MPVNYGNPGRKLEVSVLDILFGGGRTLRQLKRRACPTSDARSIVPTPIEAFKQHEESKAQDKKEEVLAIDEENKKGDEDKEWTAEYDAVLIQLKDQKKSWKEIGAILKGKDPSVKKRYKQLIKDTVIGEAETEAKKGKGKKKEETHDNERPVISRDESGDLTVDELVMFYHLEKHYNQKKWASIVSRFYEYSGKRLAMAQLKALMENKAAASDV